MSTTLYSTPLVPPVVSGDTWETEEITISDYPSDEYTAKIFLSGATPVNADGTTSNGGWTFKLSSNKTAVMTPGTYTYSVRVYKDGETFTKMVGRVRVYADPASTVSKIEFIERMITAIEKCLEGQLTTEEAVAVSSFSVGGRSLSFLSRDELIRERSLWIRKLKRLRGETQSVKSIPVDTNSLLGIRR